IGTGELRRIHSRVSWMFLPVERSITVSAPHFVDHRILSTSSSMEEAMAELPMLALIFTRKRRPMIIGSVSGWLMLEGMMARPCRRAAPAARRRADRPHAWERAGRAASWSDRSFATRDETRTCLASLRWY